MNGYIFPERTIEQVIRYNALTWGKDPDEAWAGYLAEQVVIDEIGGLWPVGETVAEAMEKWEQKRKVE